MSISELITLLAAIAALAVAGYVAYKSGQPVTLQGVQEAYVSAQGMAAELEKVALMAVASSQQLKETGRIDTNQEAFQHAFDYINSWPGLDKLDRNLVASAVEGAYRLFKATASSAGIPPQEL